MKKDIEQLLLYLVPAIILSSAITAYFRTVFNEISAGNFDAIDKTFPIFGNLSAGETISFISLSYILIGFIPKFVLSIWLYLKEKHNNGKPILWFLGSLSLGYWILILFIGYRLHDSFYNLQNKSA